MPLLTPPYSHETLPLNQEFRTRYGRFTALLQIEWTISEILYNLTLSFFLHELQVGGGIKLKPKQSVDTLKRGLSVATHPSLLDYPSKESDKF
jgi:hypothetical protein